MNNLFKDESTSSRQDDLLVRLVEAQEKLIDMHRLVQQTAAEATVTTEWASSRWTSQDIALVFKQPNDRLGRILAILSAFKHRKLIGSSGLYDRDWYVKKYPDVAHAAISADFHFLLLGLHEGRDPGPAFSQIRYALFNKDILISRTNPLIHYVTHGVIEGRQAFKSDQ